MLSVYLVFHRSAISIIIMSLKQIIREYIELIQEHVDPNDAEYESIETFATFLMDEDREEFTHEDLAALNQRLQTPVGIIRKELEAYGFNLAKRAFEKRIRGFNTSSQDRWTGPGSAATHGGAGIDTSTGRATVRGKTV
jgi:hypothetical protein